QMEDVLGRNADKTPSAFSDLPQHVRDMIIEDVSMGLDGYGFGSKSEALRALDTATIESIRYTAKVIMSFRRKDGTETGGIFSLANFRF
ncbi:MAG TPA: hypothetical protein VGE01_07165, partial [Fimbriimonas sp.]